MAEYLAAVKDPLRELEQEKRRGLEISAGFFEKLEFLDDALASLAAQTRKADEVVVTGNVMSSAHIDVTYLPSSASMADRLNTVIAASDCDAFIMLSDDDTLLPTYIEKTAGMMEQTGADIVFTEWGMITVTALISKAIWKKVGGYCDIGFFDWDFNWSALEAGAVAIFIDRLLGLQNKRTPHLFC
jgi:hypothetical protein